ncbi:MAG TPA: cytochrome c biogenesis protein DipZ [Gammaproteobacteria bacterium]|nr:cytochrome c biogenesis protein DipZ [Gammaproteobacteria bacterium]
MMSDLIVIALSFFEGFALIISPCILPILPIILAGSVSGSIRRPLGIIIGFILFFTLFTFFSRAIVQYSGIDLNFIRHISYVILLLIGIIMMSSYLTEKFFLLTQRIGSAGSGLSAINNPESGFGSGLLFGGLTALIWTPCAGPILAAVIVQTISQQSTVTGFLALFAFSIGVGLPMFVIALFGRNILNHVNFISAHTELVHKLVGAIIILSVAYIMNLEYGYTSVATKKIDVVTPLTLQKGTRPYPAPSIAGATKWINSPPLTMAELRGKVVLIDFWTYSCINCIRTLPYIKGWYEKYHDKGLVIIGVHTPEFEFEKDPANVERAVKSDGILYPVAMDNSYTIWNNFQNHYWPAHYLIDKNGDVVYTHFGEGEYDVTESNIRYLLHLGAEKGSKPKAESEASNNQTPETYFGYGRAQYFASPERVVRDQKSEYSKPSSLSKNEWALQGSWNIMPDRIVAVSDHATLTIHFNARHVYLVAGNSTGKPVTIKLSLDDKPLTGEAGKDVKNSEVVIDQHQLYEITALSEARDGELTLTVQPGVELYTFTFG